VIHLQTTREKRRRSAARDLVKQGGLRRLRSATNPDANEIFVRASLKEAGSPACRHGERVGASVYSASEAAREEFPELDITLEERSRLLVVSKNR